MNTERCQRVLHNIIQQYQKLEYYFTSGSFGVKFYPFLMHPFVRHSQSFITRSLAVLSIFMGMYFFFAELITILFSQDTLSSYFSHTIFELSLPVGTMIEDKEVIHSPLSFSIRASFLLQGYLFAPIYLLAILKMTERFRLITGLLALCFTSGMLLIYSAQGGKFTNGNLQNLGVSITFLLGNLTLIFTGFATRSPALKSFKKFSLIAGFIGLISITFTLFEPTAYLPLLERISLYATLCWEVIAGFTLLKLIKS